jgi:hypothetical protein
MQKGRLMSDIAVMFSWVRVISRTDKVTIEANSPQAHRSCGSVFDHFVN